MKTEKEIVKEIMSKLGRNGGLAKNKKLSKAERKASMDHARAVYWARQKHMSLAEYKADLAKRRKAA